MYNPVSEQRRLRTIKLFEMIKENPNISREKIIALFMLQTGVRRHTVNEYLEVLDASELMKKNV
jgi:hypothetical protein